MEISWFIGSFGGFVLGKGFLLVFFVSVFGEEEFVFWFFLVEVFGVCCNVFRVFVKLNERRVRFVFLVVFLFKSKDYYNYK